VPDKKTIDFGFADIPYEDKQAKVAEIFSQVAPSYDRMNDVMSLGAHRLWKRHLVRLAAVRPEYKICDVASGTGDVARLLAQQVDSKRGGHVTMSDINPDMLAYGYDKLFDAGLADCVTAVEANAEQLPFDDNQFDIVTMVFGLRNVSDKKQALSELRRVVKPGGKVLVMEFSTPQSTLVASMYDTYSFSVIPYMGERCANDRESYQYLVESIRRHPDQETLKAWFYEAGFDDCQVQNIATGIVAIHMGVVC
jgi:demethylmenaquinone methyltransferase/2-methoxy-6-polyprenyl-1,4-benzoquinol methylase